MSEHEEGILEVGFNTPVPELDDHRRQSVAAHRQDRPRRGTFDSLYGIRRQDRGAAQDGQTASDIRVQDFEEAIVDDGVEPETSPMGPRTSRRPTVDTFNDQRSLSPPNSVKAFAEARRRERQASISDGRDNDDLKHAMSITSRRSFRSRPHTIDDDADSLLTNKTAEEDVCFPLQEEHRKDQLYIDFDYLENFINSERAARATSHRDSDVKIFPDLRPQTSPATERPLQIATVDGDIIEMPSDESIGDKHEKEKQPEPPKAPVVQPDQNRFSFFSSTWESTIHAAELGDLVLPGEDLRGLFTLPQDESDGVWWLNMNNAEMDEVQAICRAFGIHPLTIEDITTQETREKIELFPSYYFACFRSFIPVDEGDGQEYEPFNTYVVVFREGTLSFSFVPNAHASHVRRRIAMLKDYVALSSDWICYALMYVPYPLPLAWIALANLETAETTSSTALRQ